MLLNICCLLVGAEQAENKLSKPVLGRRTLCGLVHISGNLTSFHISRLVVVVADAADLQSVARLQIS